MSLTIPLILFLVLLLCAGLGFTREIAQYRAFLAFGLATVLVLISATRAPSVGRDYSNYQHLFQDIPNILDFSRDFVAYTQTTHMEPGFLLLTALLSSFSSSDYVFFGATSFLTILLVYRGLIKYTPYPLLGLLFYFAHDYYMHNWVAIRYGIAAAIGLFIIDALLKKRHYLQAGTITAATFFHTSGLALLLSYGYYFFSLNRTRVLALLSTSIILGYAGVSGFFIENVPGFVPRAESLQSYYRATEPLGVVNGINLLNAFLLILFVGLWRHLSKNPAFLPAMYLFTLSTCIRIAFHDAGFVAGRISGMLGLSVVIILPLTAYAFRQRWAAFLLGSTVAGGLFFANIFLMGRNWYDFSF